MELQKETLYLLSSHSPFPLSPGPGMGLLKFMKEHYEVHCSLFTEGKKLVLFKNLLVPLSQREFNIEN